MAWSLRPKLHGHFVLVGVAPHILCPVGLVRDLNHFCFPIILSVHSPAYKLGCELAKDARGAGGPPGLGVALRQRRRRRPAGVGGALLVPGAPLLACVECAADAHPSGEVGTVRRGGAVDVVG